MYFRPNRLSSTMSSPTLRSRRDLPPSLFLHAGLGAVLVMVGYFMAVLVHFEWLLGSWSTPFVLMVVVSVMVMVLLTVRQEEGGLQYGRAFGLSLLAGWLARLGYNVFNLLYFGLLHPGHAEDYANMLADKSTEALAVFGIGLDAEAQDSSAMAEMFREQALWSLTPAGQAVDAMTALLWVSLVAAIVSAILRRTPDAQETLDA